MVRLAFVAFLGSSQATVAPSVADLRRANIPKPSPSSHVFGENPREVFESMNHALQSGAVPHKKCEQFSHEDLNQVARTLYSVRAPELDKLYVSARDKRALHFDSLEDKELLWQGEAAASQIHQSHAPGGAAYNVTRDGKCAEMVMWYTHHVPEPQRAKLAVSGDFALPLMPLDVAAPHLRGNEYQRQITCTDCHMRIQDPTKPAYVTPPPRPKGSGPQFQEDCSDAEKPVFYNRTKRCDWDYEPFCEPCEGIGGMTWGNGESEWTPMPCEPLMKPDEIPKENLTSPLWPKHFTVEEYASLTFPGRDPCDVKFKNSTYTLVFDTTPEGPIYHTIGRTGPSGPSPFPGKSWALPNGNFYNTVDVLGHTAFCICIGPPDPTVENAINGPLPFDFLRDSVLVGRERIVLEYVNKEVVADHWVKGPHHFWFDVATNLMVREWQPFNGHQIYHDWNLTKPAPLDIDVQERCYKGLLHVNISCIAPHPVSRSSHVMV